MTSATLAALDDLMSEISMTEKGGAPPPAAAPPVTAPPKHAQPADTLAVLDGLMGEIESSSAAAARPQARPPTTAPSNGPGGRSFGPGVSSGPGVVSSGPGGGGMSYGPGATAGGARPGVSSGPGGGGGGGGGMSYGPGGGAATASTAPVAMSYGPGAAFANAQARKDEEQKKLVDEQAKRTGKKPLPPVVQPVIAAVGPDGRILKANGPPCAACNEMIIGKVVNAMGKTFHEEHFLCEACGDPFAKGEFIEHEGWPYCERDYWDLFAAKCPRCALPVKVKGISACNQNYHANCFSCAGCGVGLAGKQYKEHEGEPYCTTCYKGIVIVTDPAAKLCGRCKLPIIGQYLIIQGQFMHPEHFKCKSCSCSFTGGNCFEYDSDLYCEECYLKMIRNICWECRKPIAGRSVTALGHLWHPEHFACAHCKEPFAGSTFHVHEGKPYCLEDFKMFCSRFCYKCNQPAIDGIVFSDQVWHPECFKCSGCECKLDAGSLQAWDGKPYCKNCYAALPKDVRKKEEKKRAMETRAKKIRELREKKEEKAADKEKKAAASAAAKEKKASETPKAKKPGSADQTY